jgi:hypothetical protein
LVGQWTSVTEPVGVASEVLQLLPLAFELETKGTTVDKTNMMIIVEAQIITVAGRLRVKWATVHNDEVYFRDTAHGLLVWAVAAVVTAGVLATAAADMAGSARARDGARAGGGAMGGAESANPAEYAVDDVFRTTRVTPDRGDAGLRAEVGRIFAHGLRSREMGGADKAYVDSLVALRTGLSQADADQRVTQSFGELQRAIDVARQRAAKLSLWVFIALLTGAFCASLAATIGGRQRDHVQHI